MEVFGCLARTRCLGLEFRVFDQGNWLRGDRFLGGG